MSYILDALKRADAERDRGAVPGLHTPPVQVGTASGQQRKFRLLLLILAGIGLLAVCGALWRWQNPVPSSPAITSSIPVPVVISTPPPVAVTVPATTPTPAPQASPQMPAVAVVAATARGVSPPAAVPVGVTKPVNVGKELQTPMPVAPPVTATTGTPIMSIAQLPPDVSQALPKLAISGSTWSDNPAYRMVILNGQVFHEGDKPGVDLTLEQITAKAVIFNFKGYRYSMPN